MHTISLKNAVSCSLLVAASMISGSAIADIYSVILKDSTGTPCVTYTSANIDIDALTLPTTENVNLENPVVAAGCSGVVFPDPIAVVADLQPFGETEMGGPSRVSSLSGSAGNLTINASGTWAYSGTIGVTPGGYFVFNTNSVPAPAALTLILLGSAGIAASALRRRKRR